MRDDIMRHSHKPVLLHESIDALNLGSCKVFVDATYGGGGHSREVGKQFPDTEIIALDQDPEAGVITANFRDIDKVVTKKVDAILFDLGFSSDQLESIPGLSFQKDAPLDMRLSRLGPTAAEILNSWDESAIELILRGFGEERLSKKIAQEVVEKRKHKPFERTTDLVEAVLAVKPKHPRDKMHPATKTFQALRITVNSELDALENGLQKGFEILNSGGRFAVISFHSLEDRIVKNFFRDKAKENLAKLITKKPIIPTPEEIRGNPRSRSAKLRVLEKNEEIKI